MSGIRKEVNAQTKVKRGQPGVRAEVSIADVKLCALCGTLNHKKNTECFTCGWRGTFDYDKRLLGLAWERLYREFEIVQFCHVSAARSFSVGELGVAVHRHPVRRNWERFKAWWIEATSPMRRPIRRPKSAVRQQPFPHNELGV